MPGNQKETLGCVPTFLIIILAIALLGGLLRLLGVDLDKSSSTTPQIASKQLEKPQPQKEEALPSASLPKTPAEYLKAAKEQLAMKSPDRPYGDIYHAAYLLTFIHVDASEYKEAQALLKKINKLKEKDLADIRENTAKDRRAKRIIYAPLLETKFLDKGFDISVKTIGKDATTLQIKYILTSRVMVHHISKDAELIKAWRDMGFKKVIITDGYRSKWYLDL